MSTSNQHLGYSCEFIDSVPEDFYCMSCNLVANKVTITSCCGETYCHTCIADNKEQGKPCPACGEKGFDLMKQMKYQKKIEKLQVYCSLKKRGCVWSGSLEQLDTHLDPDQDNCQYVDAKCPLNCDMVITKNEVEQHVALHCVKRPYVCQHCNFKAIYEEVVDKHLLECKYVPLQCPNFCGVTFERDFMEDHMKMCRLEKIRCKFSDIGCDDQFSREDQEKHTKDSTQKHLTLAANVAIETKEQLQDLVKKYKQIEQNLKQKLQEQEQNLNQKLKEQEQKISEQEKKLTQLSQILKQFSDNTEAKLSSLLPRVCTMENFNIEKENESEWHSLDMYTHIGGYKFHIAVIANGLWGGHGKAIAVYLYSSPGEFDDQLKWPAKGKFTLELVNKRGKDNAKHEIPATWNKPEEAKFVGTFDRINIIGIAHFIEHSKLSDYLNNDKLHFHISKVFIFD